MADIIYLFVHAYSNGCNAILAGTVSSHIENSCTRYGEPYRWNCEREEWLEIVSIGILVYPQVEELDFVGPFEVLSYINKIRPDSTTVMLVAENADPICAFNGMRIIPDTTLTDCPALDVVVVPGGKGRVEAMKNTGIKEFIHKQMACAQYVTSVCTGAFLLAEAGLLSGRKATTYHTAFAELEAYSVQVLSAKVVQDGKIITAGGVSSGLELGLYVLKQLYGLTIAQEVADKIEYQVDVTDL